jgi:hypothetical protein
MAPRYLIYETKYIPEETRWNQSSLLDEIGEDPEGVEDWAGFTGLLCSGGCLLGFVGLGGFRVMLRDGRLGGCSCRFGRFRVRVRVMVSWGVVVCSHLRCPYQVD